ncbi:MAG: hypothetical protein M1830_008566 [Pleopsidium flavum]|nr:MAG: hypothetical protein M1830_008566 [Pleopsidium flavum]
MSVIKNVVVVGGAGNVGRSIVKALVEAKFNVSVFTRQDSPTNIPENVAVITTDYTPASLLKCLKGQDAVVCAIGPGPGVAGQMEIIDAAVKAGVKRFIPSEFGGNTQTETSPDFVKLNGVKVEVINHLKEVATASAGFSWTGLSTGVLFDLVLPMGFLGFSIPAKTATIFDSGNAPFSATTLATLGLSVVGILQLPAETSNKYLCVASFTATQNTTLRALEESTGTTWAVKKQSAEETLIAGRAMLAKGERKGAGMMLIGTLFKDEGSEKVTKEGDLANELLGLPKENLKTTVQNIVSA